MARLPHSPFTIESASADNLPHLQRLEKVGMSHPWTARLLAAEMEQPESAQLVACTVPTRQPIGCLVLRSVQGEAEILRLVVDPLTVGTASPGDFCQPLSSS